MRFIDEAQIEVSSGHGGAGSVHFRREKFEEFGGPDGGDGGKGGDILLIGDNGLASLMDFRFKRKYAAQCGAAGAGARKSGRQGEPIILRVPVGTIVHDLDLDTQIADVLESGQEILICRGGRGGKGNSHFKSSRVQTPKFAQPGEEGEFKRLQLELKLLADVALVGLPSVGKSSLISVISAARPKVADYPFTTLTPNLGVVRVGDYESFVVADVPGLIEGAHQGTGLGIRFLKHLSRCKMYLHLVDVATSQDLKQDYLTIRKELGEYDSSLLKLKEIVVLNKMDSVADEEQVSEFCAYLDQEKIEYRKISAVAQSGTQDLVYRVANELRAINDQPELI